MPLIFSYGTLRDDEVQLATFGRVVQGQPDSLVGFELSDVEIESVGEAAVGKTHYANLAFTGRTNTRVKGMVFEITEAELAAVDHYERDFGYKRLPEKLASGRMAWIYMYLA